MNVHLKNALIPILNPNAFYELFVENGRIKQLVQYEDKIEGGKQFDFKGLMQAEQTNASYDLNGRVVLPTFADIHMHLDKSHSLPYVGNQSGTLLEAVQNYKQAAPTFSDAQIKARIRKTALSALKYGTTTIRTHIDFHTRSDQATTFRGVKMALEVKEELKDWIHIQVFPMLPYHPYNDRDRQCIKKVLTMGIDGIGGAPHLSEKPLECVEELFQFALESDLPLDLHTDESDSPDVDTILKIAELTIKHQLQGKVVVDHLCSLAAMDEEKANHVLERMKAARLMAVTLPAANMYLQGREDQGLIRRGITRINEIRAAGIPLATASDNVCDPFHPFGRADLLQIAQLTGYAAHMGGRSDLIELLKMVTLTPKKIIGEKESGINSGDRASFVLFDSFSVEQLFAELTETRAVYHNGRWVSVQYSQLEQMLMAKNYQSS
ncbi:hypothetical protein AJ85_10840 [Alkalihalobacillus alcalophilus ATCC 27647 = CGMCC 1.3604]|uniref:Amidohydrolase 3 domain-containing protein n=1 Tax=Alkalihalobacillus alcalophilus ATCC 27647 = CGMCC 1.3604 TaxID=1218173 RepID=A0A4S4JYR2_ALKAL|nr:amidohydrolase family protein [Alkalihalobacillus alcalophilus]MED1563373.1 amidohydrolase family protein [Alkalihalobacillus alcalophilus]THG90413.1 hypothetical protein AJ85_10840 [Alkalihalobacillus alcalophilus ATCC 27647 = CGMCC 1.3604]